MNHIELRRTLLSHEEEFHEFDVLLVDLDRVEGDDIDVVISPLREVERDMERRQIRLYSAAAREGGGMLEPGFGVLMDGLPVEGVLDGNFEVMVQLPIAPSEAPGAEKLVPLAGVHVGLESQEIWLLVQPLATYPSDVLPD